MRSPCPFFISIIMPLPIFATFAAIPPDWNESARRGGESSGHRNALLSDLNCNSRHTDSSRVSWRCALERGSPANCFPDYSGKADRRPVGNQKPCESASAWLSRNAIRGVPHRALAGFGTPRGGHSTASNRIYKTRYSPRGIFTTEWVKLPNRTDTFRSASQSVSGTESALGREGWFSRVLTIYTGVKVRSNEPRSRKLLSRIRYRAIRFPCINLERYFRSTT